MLKSKDLTGLYNLPVQEIELIIDKAESFKKLLQSNVKKLPHLQGRTVTTLFYENSTRTRVSFELAAKYLSAAAVNISASTSSASKGESLIDTGRTLDNMQNDFLIIRHSLSGAPAFLAANIRACVINGGDGTNEHPTQALLDIFTVREKFGAVKGLKVTVTGDILHSRVAKSNLYGLIKMGASVAVFAPKTMLAPGLESLGAIIARNKQEALTGADVVMGLRIQKERSASGYFPSIAEYAQFYGINQADIDTFCPNAIIMHPGPVNRGVEFTSQVIDSPNSVICPQVLNGVAVRMAVLTLLKGGKK